MADDDNAPANGHWCLLREVYVLAKSKQIYYFYFWRLMLI